MKLEENKMPIQLKISLEIFKGNNKSMFVFLLAINKWVIYNLTFLDFSTQFHNNIHSKVKEKNIRRDYLPVTPLQFPVTSLTQKLSWALTVKKMPTKTYNHFIFSESEKKWFRNKGKIHCKCVILCFDNWPTADVAFEQKSVLISNSSYL